MSKARVLEPCHFVFATVEAFVEDGVFPYGSLEH